MPTRKQKLCNNETYHVVLRGTEGRNLFLNDVDYYRITHNIFEFNNTEPTSWHYRRKFDQFIQSEVRLRTRLVDVLAFCLMPNHIHLLLRQLRDDGIIKFMRKLGTGYANYFNKKYERQGHLFQGRFRAVRIKTDNQLRIVFVYIHTNPAILIDTNWKEGGTGNYKKIIEFIENYKWSSYPDYLGKNNFPLATQRDFFNQIMTIQKWQKFINEWVEYKRFNGWDKSVELE